MGRCRKTAEEEPCPAVAKHGDASIGTLRRHTGGRPREEEEYLQNDSDPPT